MPHRHATAVKTVALPPAGKAISQFSSDKLNDYTHAAIGSKSNGERAAWLRGARRSEDVCVYLNVALDVSTSMRNKARNSEKTRLEVALDCLRDTVTSDSLSLSYPDILMIQTFCSTVEFGACCKPDEYDHDRLVHKIQSGLESKTGTHLWDAIAESLRNMDQYPHKQKQGKEVVRYLLVLTDGDDEGSGHSVDAIRNRLEEAALRLQNLHVVVIAVGKRSKAVEDLKKLREGCSVPIGIIKARKFDEVHMKEAFATAMDQLRMLLVKDLNGRLFIQEYKGRDPEKIRMMDQAGAAMIKGCEQVQMVTTTTLGQRARVVSGLMGPAGSSTAA